MLNKSNAIIKFITSLFKSLVILTIWLAFTGVIYWWNAPFLALNCINFSENEKALLKYNSQSDLTDCFKIKDNFYNILNSSSVLDQ